MKIGNFIFKPSKEQTRLIDLLPKTKDDSCFFDYLQSRLKHLTIEIVKKDPRFFYAKFIEKNTEYLVRFSSNGQYAGIVYEYWKDVDLKFNFNEFGIEEEKIVKNNPFWHRLKRIVNQVFAKN